MTCSMCTCHHSHMLHLPFTHIFHCPSHPPRSSSHLHYPVHLHSGSRKRILYMAPRLQVHTTTFSFRVAHSLPNACWWTTFDINIMDVIHLVFFLVHFTAQITRNTLAFGISAPLPNPPFSWFPVSLESPFSLAILLSLHAMAPSKTKQPLEPSPAAASAAVGWPNAKASCRLSTHGSSQAQSKVTFLDPLCTLSLETYQLI